MRPATQNERGDRSAFTSLSFKPFELFFLGLLILQRKVENLCLAHAHTR